MATTPVAALSTSAWDGADWAVVTRSGMLQARCGHPYGTPPSPCHAWRLSCPDGTSWRGPCYTCGTNQVPAAIQAAGAEAIAAAIARGPQDVTPPAATSRWPRTTAAQPLD